MPIEGDVGVEQKKAVAELRDVGQEPPGLREMVQQTEREHRLERPISGLSHVHRIVAHEPQLRVIDAQGGPDELTFLDVRDLSLDPNQGCPLKSAFDGEVALPANSPRSA